MVSDFRKKKLLYVFKIFFDADNSGTVTKSDFEKTIQKICNAKGWSPGDDLYKLAEKTMFEIWDGMQLKADLNKDGEISTDEWISLWENYGTQESPVDWQAYYCRAIFTIQDASSDGAIDRDEFISVHSTFGLSKDEANKAFDKASNGKDNISWEDFQQRWHEFFTSEDTEAPGNYIFGNLSF